MITKMVLKNFQRHESLEVSFSPTVTTIVGRTDAGKSAIVRALSLVCLNQPTGDSFITHDKDCTAVKLFVDKKIVTRRRGKKINTYAIGAKEFHAFGSGVVPEQVVDLLRVYETNFQFQLDQPFWFGDSAAQVSRNLNAIVNLDSIDRVLSIAAKSVRENKSVVTMTENRLALARQKVDSLKEVEVMARELGHLEEGERAIARIRAKTALLGDLIEKGNSARLKEKNATESTLDGKELISEGESACLSDSEAQRLEKLLASADRSARLASARPEADFSEVNALRESADRETELVRTLEQELEGLCQAKERLAGLLGSLSKATQNLKEASKGRCQTCGQPLPTGKAKGRSYSSPTFTSR